MHNRRKLFFILMLVLIILTTSFVAAADNVTSEVGDDTMLSVSDDVVVEENDEHNSVEKSSGSVLGLAKDVQSDKNESEKNLAKNDAQLLGVSNNDPVLGVPTYTFYSNSNVGAIVDKIKEFRQTGGIIYLNGKSFTGTGEIKANWGQIYEIKNVKIVGGSSTNPNSMAIFTNGGGYAINFKGQDTGNWRETYGSSGCKLINVTFENI